MNKTVLYLAVISAVSTLSACGGGGGGGGSGALSQPSTTTTTSQTQSVVPITTTLPSNSAYTGKGFADGYVSRLNTLRGQMGVGYLTQNSAMDFAAESHAWYLYNNYCGISGSNASSACQASFPNSMNSVVDPTTNDLYAHSEDSAIPASQAPGGTAYPIVANTFYASTPSARDILAGYTDGGSNTSNALIGEVAKPFGGPNTYNTASTSVTTCPTGEGSYSGAYPAVNGSYPTPSQPSLDYTVGSSEVDAYMNNIYHRQPLVTEIYHNIGVGFYRCNETIDFGGIDNATQIGAYLAPNTILTYPANNGTDSYPYWQTSFEQPQPLPSVSSSTALGGAISVQLPENQIIGVTSFVLKDQSGNTVPTYTVDSATDTSGYVWQNYAFFVPQSPLQLGQTYTATFTGTADGSTPITTTWSFNTPANQITLTNGSSYNLSIATGRLIISASSPSQHMLVGSTTGFPGYISLASTPNTVTISLNGTSTPAVGTVLNLYITDQYYPSTPQQPITVTITP